MPDTYKLTYFGMRGLAEPARYLLSYLDADFEDIRLQGEQWKALKPTTPYGKLPILEINGKTISQSVAISRYLGRKAGLGGKNEWEDLQIDMQVESTVDLMLSASYWFHEKNETEKAKKRETLLNETIPHYIRQLDKLMEANNGYIANGKLSWGDIFIVALIFTINFLANVDLTTKSSNLKELCNKVNNIPKIKSWIDRRPKDQMPGAK